MDIINSEDPERDDKWGRYRVTHINSLIKYINYTSARLIPYHIQPIEEGHAVTHDRDDRDNHRAHMRVRLRMVAPPMYVNTRNLSARYVAAYSKAWCMNEYSGMITDGKKLKFIPMLTVDLPFAASSGK